MPSDDVPRDLAEVDERLTPMFVSVVTNLAAKGMTVEGVDPLDLVYDFYVKALPRVLARYDPSKARITTYLYGAFRLFAARRIAREKGRKEVLVPLEKVTEHVAAAAAVPGAETDRVEALDQRLTAALARLPPEFRNVLDARLVRRENERDIAERLGLTRHAVRQQLAEAFGRVAVAMDHVETICPDLRPFALRLWRDEIPLMRVAKEMRLTRRAAQKLYRKLVRSLIAAARALEDVPSVHEEVPAARGRRRHD
jgi:RNA polymerase sigma factor (sigma-70 family)